MPIKTAEIPRPMVLIALTYLAGHVAGQQIPLPLMPALAAAGLLLAWAALRYWQSRRLDGPEAPSSASIFLILVILGMAQSARLDREDRQDALATTRFAAHEAIDIQGTVAEEPRLKAYSTQILLENTSITPADGTKPDGQLLGRVALIVKSHPQDGELPGPDAVPLPGQILRLRGDIQPPGSARNPGSFDAEAYWRGRGVVALMTVEHASGIETMKNTPSLNTRFHRLMRRARTALGDHMDQQLPPREAALARALFLGESWKLDRGQLEPFKVTGLMHILCVSGLHTGFVLLLLMGMGRVAGLSPRRCALLGMAGLLAYACLTGLRPPVVRAMLMAELILGGLVLARHISPLASFATAAFLTLAADPRNLLRLDWQLSYLCVGSILVFTPPIYELITRQPKDPLLQRNLPAATPWAFWIRNFIIIPLTATLAIQLGIVPFQILKFGQVNPLIVVNNLVGSYLTMFSVFSLALSAMVCAVAAVLAWAADGLKGVADGLVWLSFRPVWAMLWLLGQAVEKTARHGAAPINPGALPLWFMVAYYALLTGGQWLRRGRDAIGHLDRRQRSGAMLRILTCFALIAWTPLVPHGGRYLDLYMLDVGQGDGMVIRFPNGKIMVIDAGDRRPIDQGAWTIAPFLRSLGVQRIDCLVATHGDADHIGGMASLLGEIPASLLLQGAGTERDTTFNRDLAATVHEKKIPAMRPHTGEILTGFEPARVRVLAPDPGATGNDGSVVLEIAYGQTEILLTGDLELRGEQRLIESGRLGDVEVLKVGHHGSLSSSSGPFLAACRPELALISVGEDNRFGHPSHVVLDRLDKMGARSLRTDRQGALWIRTDGHRIRACRYLGR